MVLVATAFSMRIGDSDCSQQSQDLRRPKDGKTLAEAFVQSGLDNLARWLISVGGLVVATESGVLCTGEYKDIRGCTLQEQILPSCISGARMIEQILRVV